MYNEVKTKPNTKEISMSAFSFIDNLNITCNQNILKIKKVPSKSFKSFRLSKQSKRCFKRK